LNLALDSLTVADDYSAKEHFFFYAHDAGSLSLYVVVDNEWKSNGVEARRLRRSATRQ
jgi:hypothetical protein